MPAVVNVITMADAFEGASAGTFRILRDSAPPTPLPVNYTVGGNATAGVEYTALSGTATIPAFAPYVDVGVSAINDATGRPPMVVLLILANGSGYTIGSGSESPMLIFDNDNPTATADAFGGDEDDVITGNVLTNDTDPNSDPLTAAVLNGPWFGELVLNSNGSFTYTPPADFSGPDWFTYTVSDGTGGTAVGTVTLTVDPVDDDPVIGNQEFAIYENMPDDTPVGFVEAYDPDYDQTLTYSITAGNGAGVFEINPATGLIYVADNTALNYESATSFALTVQVTDDGTTPRSETATVTINVLNLPEDEEETEAERIGWLNNRYDYVITLFEGGEFGETEYSALNPGVVDGAGANVLAQLSALNIYAEDMLEDIDEDDSTGFRVAMGNFEATYLADIITEFPAFRNQVFDAAGGLTQLLMYSEGDLFRIEGVKGLVGVFNGYLTGVANEINTTIGKILDVYTSLDSFSLEAGNLFAAIQTLSIHLSSLNASSNQLAAELASPPSFENPSLADPPILDDAEDDITAMNFAYSVVEPTVNSADFGSALSKLGDLFTDGVAMIDSIGTLNIEQFGFGDKPAYVADLTAFWGEGFTPMSDLSPGELANQSNFALVGAFLRAADNASLLISSGNPNQPGALEIQDEIAEEQLGVPVEGYSVDKLRVRGIGQAVLSLDATLNQIQTEIEGLKTQLQAMRTLIESINEGQNPEPFPDENFSETDANPIIALYDHVLGAIASRRTTLMTTIFNNRILPRLAPAN